MTAAVAIAWLAGHRHFLTLAAVCAAAAAVFAWGQRGYDQRDQLDLFARSACAAAGASYVGSVDAKDPADRLDGVVCLNRIALLQDAVSAASSATGQALGAAIDARASKEQTDTRLRTASNARAQVAAQQMEAADAAVQDDRAGPGWFASINGVAGLQPPGR